MTESQYIGIVVILILGFGGYFSHPVAVDWGLVVLVLLGLLALVLLAGVAWGVWIVGKNIVASTADFKLTDWLVLGGFFAFVAAAIYGVTR